MNLAACRAVIDGARADGREALFEHEAYALLEEVGIAFPTRVFVPSARDVTAADLGRLAGTHVVLKGVAPALLHKSEVGAVAVVPRTPDAVGAAAAAMRVRLAGAALAGFLVAEFVDHDRGPGGELLASVRRTAEFGAVATFALGGVHAEFLSTELRDEVALTAASPLLGLPADLATRTTAARLLTQPMRGLPPRLDAVVLSAFMKRLLALARVAEMLELGDCEMNPVVVSGGGLVALDALVTLRMPSQPALPRPLQKLPALLQPARIAVVGVSDHLNPGRIILRNVLREGTPRERITVVKPGHDEIDGCLAVPSVRDLPSPVDLLVVAVAAGQAPDVIEDAVTGGLAETIVLIPGGFEEKEGSAELSARIRRTLDASRATPSRGPLLVGGNCLGIRSRPGRYDTLFIPEEKLPPPQGPSDPLALILAERRVCHHPGVTLDRPQPTLRHLDRQPARRDHRRSAHRARRR